MEKGRGSSIMLTLCCRVGCYDSALNIDFDDELLDLFTHCWLRKEKDYIRLWTGNSNETRPQL